MTTSDAAEFLGATDLMGGVEAGRFADLVLLDANPVESADHLHRIGGVVRDSCYCSPAELDAIREKVAASRSVS
jgi:predicted amidohydrolase YtcJ